MSAIEKGFEGTCALDEDRDKIAEDSTDGDEDNAEEADDDGVTSPLNRDNSFSSARFRSSKSLPLEA